MSLQRVLEPEVMDSFQEASDYDAMDHAAVNQAFVRDLLAAVPVGQIAQDRGQGEQAGELEECLDLGTGTAQIPVALCQACADCRVLAIDLSPHMLDVARYNIEAAGLAERIMLAHIDAKGLPFDDGRFPVVMSNSIVHHLPDPGLALREAARVAAENGWLFFRDLMRPRSDAEVDRLVQQYAAEENDHQRQMFADSLRAALNLEEIGDLVQRLGAPRDSVRATSDRHWTWAVRRSQLRDASE